MLRNLSVSSNRRILQDNFNNDTGEPKIKGYFFIDYVCVSERKKKNA